MRPVGQRQSGLRFPLDVLLGSEANVRVLRVLVASEEPCSYAQLARLARLTWTGARVAVDSLEEAGAVTVGGSGRRRQVALREGMALAAPLREMFAAEATRVEALERDLSSLVDAVRPAPMAAWIYGPVAEGQDELGESITLALLAGAGEVDTIAQEIEGALPDIERRHDVLIDLEGYTRADLRSLPVPQRQRVMSTVWTIAGPHPLPLVEPSERSGSEPKSHAAHDSRSRALGTAIASMLPESPDLIDRARRHLETVLATAPPQLQRDLRQWHRVLGHGSSAQVRRLLRAGTERAIRLRQSMPFVQVMTDAERAEAQRRAEVVEADAS